MEEIKKTEETSENTEQKKEKQLRRLFSIVTKRGQKKTYPKNRVGMRQAMSDSGALKGHSRRSAASAKLHKPTAAELNEWADWKAEQKAKRHEQAAV